ncbi:MAG: RIP metalloprotease RseP [Culicoidibacterales bacterium]
MSVILNIIIFVIILGIIVTIHEFGHFLFAKRAGILCREFSIGMGPKLWHKKIGETTYSIRALPIGGFVAMAGEDGDDLGITPKVIVAVEQDETGKITHFHLNADDAPTTQATISRYETVELDLSEAMVFRGYLLETVETEKIEQVTSEANTSIAKQLATLPIASEVYLVENGEAIQLAPENRRFGAKTPWQKFLTIFAGPAMNFILAFIILFGIFGFSGTPVNDPIIGEVVANSPAARYGLEKGDEITKFAGEAVTSYQEIVELTQAKPDEVVTVEFTRDDQPQSIEVKIAAVEREVMDEAGNVSVQTVGQLGVYRSVSYNPLLAIQASFEGIYSDVTSVFVSLGMLFSGAASVNDLSGPVGIAVMTSQVTQAAGFTGLLRWMAFLSVNIGFLNLLPLPALDGGRLVFVAYEAITRKKANPKFEMYLNLVGIVLLFGLIIYVTFNDILRLF